MKLAIMQPYFFPYLGYFQLIHAVDRFILHDNLNYIKYGWVNRNRALINQQPRYFIVPVQNSSSYSKIRDIRVSTDPIWRKKLLKLMFYTYRRAPHFEEIFPLIENVVNLDTEFLTQLNLAAIKAIAELLDIRSTIVTDVTNYQWLEDELSSEVSRIKSSYEQQQGLADRKTIRVLCICKAERADTFINAIGGQALYDKQIFKRNGIDLLFIRTLPYSYTQTLPGFVPGLSIIDVLMNCGKDGTRELLDKYELI